MARRCGGQRGEIRRETLGRERASERSSEFRYR